MLIAGFTLFFNKYILTYLEGDPTLLGVMQMVATLVCGYVMVYSEGKDVQSAKPPGFVRHMAIVGGLRFCTVLAGLLALNYVAVSFTETVKSSAPAFTVVISRLILGQASSHITYVSKSGINSYLFHAYVEQNTFMQCCFWKFLPLVLKKNKRKIMLSTPLNPYSCQCGE